MHYLIDRYITVRSLALVMLDAGIITWGTAASVWLRLGHSPVYTFSSDGYGWQTALIVLVHMVVLYYHELYAPKGRPAGRLLAVPVTLSVAIASLVLWGIYYLFPGLAIGRGIFLINILLLPPLLVGSRLMYLWLENQDALRQRVAILGDPEQVAEVAARLSDLADYQVVGTIVDDAAASPDRAATPVAFPGEGDAAPTASGDLTAAHAQAHAVDTVPTPSGRVPVIGTTNELRRLVPYYRIDTVIVALKERRGRLPLQDLLQLKLHGVGVETLPQFLERVTGRVPVEGLPPSNLVFSESLRRIEAYQRIKRLPDMIVAALVLVLLTPLLALLWLAVRLDSPGPGLYRQTRVGMAGMAFEINKFRTMRTDAEAQGGAQFAGKNDPRVTRLGAFLRKSRLDELPQLLNVLRGEMSFVGPRPERPEFVAGLQQEVPYYYLRTVVRPGITGWAQIRYPYGETVDQHREKLEHDLYYIKNISAAMDTLIALDTVRVMLFARGSR